MQIVPKHIDDKYFATRRLRQPDKTRDDGKTRTHLNGWGRGLTILINLLTIKGQAPIGREPKPQLLIQQRLDVQQQLGRDRRGRLQAGGVGARLLCHPLSELQRQILV